LKFELLPHLAHSPDLAPSDYHIFRLSKDALHRPQFAKNEKVKNMVHIWLCTQPKTFFADGSRKLLHQVTNV